MMTEGTKQELAQFRADAKRGFKEDAKALAITALLKVCTTLAEEVVALADEVEALKKKRTAKP